MIPDIGRSSLSPDILSSEPTQLDRLIDRVHKFRDQTLLHNDEKEVKADERSFVAGSVAQGNTEKTNFVFTVATDYPTISSSNSPKSSIKNHSASIFLDNYGFIIEENEEFFDALNQLDTFTEQEKSRFASQIYKLNRGLNKQLGFAFNLSKDPNDENARTEFEKIKIENEQLREEISRNILKCLSDKENSQIQQIEGTLRLVLEELKNAHKKMMEGYAEDINEVMNNNIAVIKRTHDQLEILQEQGNKLSKDLRKRISSKLSGGALKTMQQIEAYAKDLTHLPSTEFFKEHKKTEFLKGQFTHLKASFAKVLLLPYEDFPNKFSEISLYHHMPKRQDLIKLAEHVVQAGNNLEQQIRRNLSKEDPKYPQKLQALNAFKTQLDSYPKFIQNHHALGNAQSDSHLSLKSLKEDLKKAEEAIDEISTALITSLSKIVELDGKTRSDAKKIFQQARESVWNDKKRWKPIDRELQLVYKENEKTTLEHHIECNSGIPYSCAAFRGRTAGEGLTVPNFHKTTIGMSTDGTQHKSVQETLTHCGGKFEYTTSATNVEFFQKNEELRRAATEQQTLEIFASKAADKWNKLDNKEKEGLGTADNPFKVPITMVNLLTPDVIREWVHADPTRASIYHKFAGKHIDESQLERRILRESVDAAKSFDAEKAKSIRKDNDHLQFINKEGKLETVTVKVINGTPTFIIPILEKDGEKRFLHVQFDVATYNFGCDQWAYQSNTEASEWNKTTKGALFKFLYVAAGISGEDAKTVAARRAGMAMEKSLNAEAFKKQTKRYLEKISIIDGEIKTIRASQKVDEGSIDEINQLVDKTNKLLKERTFSNKSFKDWQMKRNELAHRLEIALNNPENTPETNDLLRLIAYKQNLIDLHAEISEQLETLYYTTKEAMTENIYSMPATVAIFSALLEENPHSGCRSARDRTTLLRVEFGTKAASFFLYNRFLHYKEIEKLPSTDPLRTQVFLESGQHVLAEQNIGIFSFNFGAADLHGRMFNNNTEMVKVLGEGAGKAMKRVVGE